MHSNRLGFSKSASGAHAFALWGQGVFFYDVLMMYLFHLSDLDEGEQPSPPPAFLPEFDLTSMDFVSHAMVAGYKKLQVPWIVQHRAKYDLLKKFRA